MWKGDGKLKDDNRGSPKGPLKNKNYEKFVQNVISGMSQRKAYIDAYPKAAKWKEQTTDSRASELFRKIIGRYNELMEEHKAKALWTRERAVEELLSMLEDSKKDKNFTGRHNAIKELNTLEDIYPRDGKNEKVESNITFNIQSVPKKTTES
jgi:hypothetical protein